MVENRNRLLGGFAAKNLNSEFKNLVTSYFSILHSILFQNFGQYVRFI